MHRHALILGALALTACVTHPPVALVAPPAYPWPGFGRIGCYAGPSLARMASSDVLPPDANAHGPWLVLDSLTHDELRAAGYRESDIQPHDFSPASLLERRDTLERTSGQWHRAPPDSIIFDERTTFPSVSWHLRVEGDSVVGQAVLVHDVVIVRIDAATGRRTSEMPVSRWPVRLRRVDCATVPAPTPRT